MLPLKVVEKHTVGAGGEASVTFSDILARVPTGSRHIMLLVNAATELARDSSHITIQLNEDSGAKYNEQYLGGIDATAYASRISNQTSMQCLNMPGTNYGAGDGFGGGIVLFPHAFQAVNHKSFGSLGGGVEYSAFAWTGRAAITEAIDSILLTPTNGQFAENSIIILCVVDEDYLIEEKLLTEDGAVVFDNIPQYEGDLAVLGTMRSDNALGAEGVYHEINDDAVATNYYRQRLQGIGTVKEAQVANNDLIGICTGDSATALVFGLFYALYSQYKKSDNDPHILTLSGYHEASTSYIRAISARRNNVEAITKIKYKPSAGGDFKAGTLVSLYHLPPSLQDRQELAAPAAEVTHDSILADYLEWLVANIYARTQLADTRENILVSFNNDLVDANYNYQLLYGLGATVSASRVTASRRAILVLADSGGASEYGGGVVLIPGYRETNRHKHYIVLGGVCEEMVTIWSGRWESLVAITEIDWTPMTGPNILAESIFELGGMPAFRKARWNQFTWG